jgi:hypothetical protein
VCTVLDIRVCGKELLRHLESLWFLGIDLFRARWQLEDRLSFLISLPTCAANLKGGVNNQRGSESSNSVALSVVATILATLSLNDSGAMGSPDTIGDKGSRDSSSKRSVQLAALDVVPAELHGEGTEQVGPSSVQATAVWQTDTALAPVHEALPPALLAALGGEAPVVVPAPGDSRDLIMQSPFQHTPTDNSQHPASETNASRTTLQGGPINMAYSSPSVSQSQTDGAGAPAQSGVSDGVPGARASESNSVEAAFASPVRQQSSGLLPLRMASAAVAVLRSPTIAGVRASAGAVASSASTHATNVAQSAVARLPSLRNVFKRSGSASSGGNADPAVGESTAGSDRGTKEACAAVGVVPAGRGYDDKEPVVLSAAPHSQYLSQHLRPGGSYESPPGETLCLWRTRALC